ncbi:MAG: glycosyltransferase [Verrucomicrobia bacterium]|nr:glycosyltransferase [Verrucomicrobiota bacterium]
MNAPPQVSVVMSVYNGADRLVNTLNSILSQEGVDVEFIVVNDGSTDETPSILRRYAEKDNRLTIIDQTNRGLTRSLIRGCKEARGEFIARQDAGDISLPERLQKEVDFLVSHPEVVLVSCGTRFVDPQGECVHEVMQSEDEAREGLGRHTLAEIRGPSSHGATMFRRRVYEKAGGYRSQFHVAQDLDLWTRLVEHGEHAALQEILIVAELSPDSISSTKRALQISTAVLILECARGRNNGGDETSLLKKVETLGVHRARNNKRFKRADFFYFLGSCTAYENKDRAHGYFRESLKNNPLHIKALFRYLKTAF